MRTCLSTILLAAAAAIASAPAPAAAVDFNIFGSYWETNDVGHTGGGGLSLGLPINDAVAVELRGTYYERLREDPLSHIFHTNDPLFRKKGINVTPLEVGARFSFAPEGTFRPYLGIGGGYFLLDSDFGNVADEVGYYARVGAAFGAPKGVNFFAEATYRRVEGTVQIDPEDLGDVIDLNVSDRATLNLDGFAANVGIRFNL
jgi:outer membrane protein W